MAMSPFDVMGDAKHRPQLARFGIGRTPEIGLGLVRCSAAWPCRACITATDDDRVAALSGHARVRRIAIALPLAPGALFEPPLRGTGWALLCQRTRTRKSVLGTGTFWMRQPHARHADARA